MVPVEPNAGHLELHTPKGGHSNTLSHITNVQNVQSLVKKAGHPQRTDAQPSVDPDT